MHTLYSAFAVSFYSEAAYKKRLSRNFWANFDNGVIFLNQSQFIATRGNQIDYSVIHFI